MNIVILAGGRGTRMGGDKPKVLRELGGKPMILHTIEIAKALTPSRIIVVESPDKLISNEIGSIEEIEYVEQHEPKGTGHALISAEYALDKHQPILTLYGDTPLTDTGDLQKLISESFAVDALGGLLTAYTEEENQFGRIKRNKDGWVTDVIQYKDATPEERKIKEVDAGPMFFTDNIILNYIKEVLPSPVTGEIYLNKSVILASNKGYKFVGSAAKPNRVMWGINTPEELKNAEDYLNIQKKSLE